MPTALIVLIVVLTLAVPLVGVLAATATFGVRKYLANAKTAEVRNTLAYIAKSAAAAREMDPNGRICPSASAAIPRDRKQVSGRKYPSTPSEWLTDEKAGAGFACLRFSMDYPQYYQYEYEATATGFTARGHGDLNGDGVFSTFEIQGRLVNGALVIAPSILETNPEE